MDDLEKRLQQLSKIEPQKGFIDASKNRLLTQIKLSPQESWLKTWFGKTNFNPSTSFVRQARVRLMAQIRDLPQPVKLPLKGLAYFLHVVKKALASTFVMFLAVTVVLFQLEGNTIVEASENSYVEVSSGTAYIKHPTLSTWEQVKSRLPVQTGDIIQLKEGSQAVVHFFDDTQVRLGEKSTMAITQLKSSPAFEDQGMIQTSLQEGQAWVQTLNVEDGHAGFALQTPEGIMNTVNGSFSVQLNSDKPSQVAIFEGSLKVSSFSEEGKLLKKTNLTPDKMVRLYSDEESVPDFEEATITPELKADPWIDQNLKKDQEHLAEIRDKKYEQLTMKAGTLPGDTLYSIKQAKEQLRLVWSDKEGEVGVKIDMANNRLNEAMVLLQQGDEKQGQEALKAYQDLAQELSQVKPASTDNSGQPDELMAELVVPHQKLLVSQPADKNSLIVKETLQKTAEVLAQSPLELESIRLKNSVANLQDIRILLENGEVNLAKEKLTAYQAVEVKMDLLDGLNEEEKKVAFQQVLDIKTEEKELLALVSEKMVALKQDDEDLVAIVDATTKKLDAEVEQIQEAALPVLPELAEQIEEVEPEEVEIIIASDPVPEEEILATNDPEILEDLSEAEQIASRINIYSSWDGQMNQIERLLGEALEDPSKINFLLEVQKYLKEGRIKNYLNNRILQLQNKTNGLEIPEPEVGIPTESVPPTIDPVEEEIEAVREDTQTEEESSTNNIPAEVDEAEFTPAPRPTLPFTSPTTLSAPTR